MQPKVNMTKRARLMLAAGLCAVVLASCGGEDATDASEAIDELTSESGDTLEQAGTVEEEAMEDEEAFVAPSAQFTDLALGPIENRDQLSALDGSGWFIENTSTDRQQSGALSFTWDQDRGLVGLFSDECSLGEFLLNDSTAAGWEVVRTNSDFEVGCDRLLGQVFDTGSVVQISRTEAGLSFDAGDIGSFDATQVESAPVQDGPAAEVEATDRSLSE